MGQTLAYLRWSLVADSARGDVELVEVGSPERAGCDHVGVLEADLAHDLLGRRIDLNHLLRSDKSNGRSLRGQLRNGVFRDQITPNGLRLGRNGHKKDWQ